MATIITRLFEDETAAKAAAKRVVRGGIPERAITMISGGEAETLRARMTRAAVHESAVAPYVERVQAGHTLLVVRATYKPLGAARITRETLAKSETLDAGPVVNDHFIPDGPERATSILKSHPRFFTMPLSRYASGHVTAGLGFPLLSRKRRRTTASLTGARVSRMIWPMPLLSRKARAIKVKRGGGYMSRAFWPMPLLLTRPRDKSVIPGGGPVFSKTLDWPTA